MSKDILETVMPSVLLLTLCQCQWLHRMILHIWYILHILQMLDVLHMLHIWYTLHIVHSKYFMLHILHIENTYT